jgi:hypothetical protein
MERIQELTDLSNYFRSSSEDSTQLDSRHLIGLRLHFYYKTGTFSSGEPQVGCGVLNSIGRGAFIGVSGAITDLIKSEIHQVLAGRPWSVTCTDSRCQVPFYRLL